MSTHGAAVLDMLMTRLTGSVLSETREPSKYGYQSLSCQERQEGEISKINFS
jgi:hypothetical protein